ncbi:MAG: alanine--tRNA ligase [Chloroflexi bacterium]|nr:alanine--tRNA ligase [Chloroflexota bacterium]
MESAQIRQKFLDFFEARGHTIVPSSSLVPAQDPTLLFTNAGMVPFKDVFLGNEKRSYTRAASAQKCLRVSGKHNDLEEVGPSPQHHTFFEMLGNFSFGDYFKEEALEFSWQFLTQELGLPADKLHPTVFEEDDESAKIWARIKSVPESQIVRLGAEHNFWSMGDTGPCGPNSEIIYDRSGACLKNGGDCDITCDCDRWWELWNNVFMQFDRAADGTQTPLAKPGVDTGMGFERLVAVIQNVPSNYETDLFVPLFEEISDISGTGYREANNEQRIAMRILADHARAATFLIADGIRPSNEGRGYVLRRLLRRAIYYGRTRFIWNEQYLGRLVRRVGGVMSDAYPELHKEAASLIAIVEEEEHGFAQTLGRGRVAVERLAEHARYLRDYLQKAARNQQYRFNWASSQRSLASLWSSSDLPEDLKISFLKPYSDMLGEEPWNASPKDLLRAADIPPILNGEVAFFFKDTYGIPPDLTAKVAEEEGLGVDLAGFNRALEEQRERGRGARKLEGEQDEALLAAARELEPTRFVGYEALATDAKVLALFSNEGRSQSAREGDTVELVLDTSPFYAEGGGQVGDAGRIVGPDGEVAIASVRRLGPGVFVHSGEVARGQIAEGATVRAEVDETTRRGTMRNHTATHLLHKALRQVLGPQAKQAGSLVAPDRLRFDFLHSKPLTNDELREAERIVREQIMRNQPVRTDVMPLQQALDLGADAMFDEKYGEEARVVSVGDNNGEAFSRELCGGTHCHATGEIGAFFIVDQRSVGSGVRRVDAVTGFGAFEWMDARRDVIEQLSREYNAPLAELPERLRALQERAREQPKQTASHLPDPGDLIERAEKRDGTLLIVDTVDAADAASLREFGDELRARAKSAAIVLGALLEEKPSILIMLTSDQVEAGLHAGKLAKQIGKEMGAGGGGRADVATAGGRDPAQLDTALELARELLRGASAG